ncbi:MAG: hypothetical protein Q9160_007517 [Pyrenula sp. 1 TL-2023]
MANLKALILPTWLLFAQLIGLSQAGYVIDTASCGPSTSEMNKSLRKQLESAFSMYKNANKQLQPRFGDFLDHADQNVKDPYGLLFNQNAGDYAAVKSETAKSTARINPKPKDGVAEFWDDDFKRWMKLTPVQRACRDAGDQKPEDYPTAGFAYIEPNLPMHGGQKFPDIIQICEWYAKGRLDKFFPKKLALWMLKIPGFTKIPALESKSKIDGFDLADTTLLHEVRFVDP